jgi:glycosyltransferase involved in cell wall biosynthesis
MANLSAPELRHLASEFARREQLITYVCRYANQDRWWETMLERLPAVGDLFAKSLGRRRLPPGLLSRHVTESGVLQDFTAAIVSRLGLPDALSVRVATRLNRSAVNSIARKVARLGEAADIVVAGVGTATPMFQAAAGRRVLNYPSAHHRFQREFFAAARETMPEFARLGEEAMGLTSTDEAQFDDECARADLILTGSEFARSSFLAQGIPASRVAAIPYGVDCAQFTPGTTRRSDGRFRIVYVGRISYRKGIGYLLHALRQIKRPDMELTLVGNIIGDPSCLTPYSSLFTHLPHMSQSRLAAIYRDADLFVFPSLLEGLGLVALEAMGCGCPVVVSRNGPGDVVRDGVDGYVVPAEDAEALAFAIEKIYLDRELRESMSRQARIRAEHFDWARYRAHASAAVLGELNTHVESMT